MASFSLLIKPSAAREIEALPRQERERIVRKIEQLAEEPRPVGCERLTGQDRHRLRQGDYRIVYAIDSAARTVLVVKVGHRRDVYR